MSNCIHLILDDLIARTWLLTPIQLLMIMLSHRHPAKLRPAPVRSRDSKDMRPPTHLYRTRKLLHFLSSTRKEHIQQTITLITTTHLHTIMISKTALKHCRVNCIVIVPNNNT